MIQKSPLLLPLVDVNPFETLGIAPSFSLDAAELAARQRELSKALHPDRFVGRPPGERRDALGRAIEVNEAHRALKNPLTRAQALLEHLHWSIDEHDLPPASPELLMETMERREALRDAATAKDEARVESLKNEVKAEERELLDGLSELFASALSDSASPQSAVAARIQQKLVNLRYVRRFLDEADAILDELF